MLRRLREAWASPKVCWAAAGLLVLLLLLATVLAASVRGHSRREVGQTEVVPAVVGGSDAPPGRFEYMGSLFSNRPGGGFFCAGTLIAPRIFMTAAHCVVNETTGEPKAATSFWPKVHIGGYNRTQGSGIDLRTVLVTRPHPDFGYADKDPDRKFFNDVAIMLLDRPSTKPHVHLPPFIQKPRLPVPPGTRLTALGWGDTRPGTFSPSEPLQQLELALRPLRACQRVFPKSPGYRKPENTLICAGNAPGYPSNICKGDSGGPLLQLGIGGTPGGSGIAPDGVADVQLGISSFTHNASVCLGEPAGFTNLAQLGPWIAEIIDDLTAGLWVGRVYGDMNVQTFGGAIYPQQGTAGQQLNIVTSGVYTLAGWLKRQPSGFLALGAAQFQSGPSTVAVGVVNGTLLVRLNGKLLAAGSTTLLKGGSLKFAALKVLQQWIGESRRNNNAQRGTTLLRRQALFTSFGQQDDGSVHHSLHKSASVVAAPSPAFATAAALGGSPSRLLLLPTPVVQAGKERVVTLKHGRALTIAFVQPYAAEAGGHAPRLDVSVRYRRMPDYQLSGLLGSTFPYQPKPQAQAQ